MSGHYAHNISGADGGADEGPGVWPEGAVTPLTGEGIDQVAANPDAY